MNEFLLIKDYFQDKFPDDQIDMIQHSRNPLENDVIHLLLFRNTQLSYIVSTYRKNSTQRLYHENDVMKNLLNKIECPDQNDSILFNTNLIQNHNGVFRIQKYLDNKTYRRRLKGLKYSFLCELIDHSNLWIEKLQSVSGYHYSDSCDLLEEVTLLVKQYNKRYKGGNFLLELKDSLDQLKSPLKRSFTHGDFCPYNYCFKNGKFFVFDWEYASVSYWAFYDHLLNFITIWIQLFARNRVTEISFILSSSKLNKYECLLKNYASSINERYELSIVEFKSLIVFVYFKNYLRKESHKDPFSQPYSENIVQLLH